MLELFLSSGDKAGLVVASLVAAVVGGGLLYAKYGKKAEAYVKADEVKLSDFAKNEVKKADEVANNVHDKVKDAEADVKNEAKKLEGDVKSGLKKL